jgi:hypothetical protein
MRSDSESLPSPNAAEHLDRGAAFDNIEVQDDESTTTADKKPHTAVTGHGKHRQALMPAPPPPLKKQKLTKSKQASSATNALSETNVQPKRVTFVTPITTPSAPKKGSTKKQRRK